MRSGGHCLEGFVDDPAVECVIDLSRMDSVYYDPGQRAFAVEAGATFGRLYPALDMGWGVTLPGSTCPSVGVGGHVIGGGFGALSRLHGCISDHLYAVESVVVDANGKAKPVIATRDEGDSESRGSTTRSIFRIHPTRSVSRRHSCARRPKVRICDRR